jgi:hypothetical protein
MKATTWVSPALLDLGYSAAIPSLPSFSQDSVYIFREGALPPYRQMFYQLCDLNVEEYV